MSKVLYLQAEKKEGRLDKFLSDKLADYSRSEIQKWIEEGAVLVNDAVSKSNYKVAAGDRIEVNIPEEEELTLIAEDLPLDILYEDDDLLVVNKAAGQVVHPALGNSHGTLVNALLHHTDQLSQMDTLRPGIVHRLDKETSGVLVVAKNDTAHEYLAAQFKNRTPLREYLAVVEGQMSQDEGTIHIPIGRNPKQRKQFAAISSGKEAITHFQVRAHYPEYSVVTLQLETGRTHQIRVHLSHLNHPVVGDVLYGRRKSEIKEGQLLHAARIGFEHPTTGETMIFEASLPDYFQAFLNRLEFTDN